MKDAMLPRVRPAVRWTIGALVLTFLVALGTVAATLVSRAQLEALSYNKAQLTRFVSVADAALNRAFFSIDVLLTSTDDLLDLSSSMVAWSRGDAASALLNGIMRQNLLVRSVALLDSQVSGILHSWRNAVATVGVSPTMITATWNGTVIAESDHTTMVEGNHYFPMEDVRADLFVASDKTSHCPWKGDASYYSIVVDGTTNADAAWTYRSPKDAAKEIAGHVAFWKGVAVTEG